MAVTRADSFTSLKKTQEYFSDFLDSFAKTPVGNQLGRVTNDKSVNQSLYNLIKTNLGERLFQPNIGGNIYASLFELNDFLLASNLKTYIERTVEINEPRINLIDVRIMTNVYPQFTNEINENTVKITIEYNLINNPEPITVSYVLKRVR